MHLPGFLEEQIAAAQETGFYASEAELVADAVRTLLAARLDVRLATACRFYEQSTLSLDKAAELAGLDLERPKRARAERGISRTAPESLAETTARARVSLQKAGRAA
jgi:Arc/MetJ-type ribon-helix-helix transcriptional regulator